MPSSNPRYKNSARRNQLRRRLIFNAGVCYLCKKPIDTTLKTPHPMSAEVHEIIPVSKDGSPIDPDNCVLTHRICNQRQGNKITSKITIKSLPLPTSRDW